MKYHQWQLVTKVLSIHKVTVTSFAIGQCCRLHVIGQQVVSDISAICSCWSICSLWFWI